MNPHVILFAGYVLFVAYVGYALGKSDLRIRPALTAITVVLAAILHWAWQLALPHEEIDLIARAVARRPNFPTLAAVAIVETAGIWLPVLVIDWVAVRTRIWGSAYIIAATTLGAFANYGPSFDPPPVSHPDYSVWLLFAPVVTTAPFALGGIAKRRHRAIASSADCARDH